MAATTVIVALASACGGGSSTGPNNDPVANFTVGACSPNVACTFTDASTDPEGNNTITTRKWNFGDGTAEVTDPALTQSHTFASAGTFQVTLTVTDNGGRSNSKTNPVTVGTANQPPVASFVSPSCTAAAACAFSSTSTDADGSITATHWEFGEPSSPNNTADGLTASHTYATAGTFNVTLTVTDDKLVTGTVTQPVTVTPAGAQQCTSATTFVDCVLDITARATVKITLSAVSCELGGSHVSLPPPIAKQVFGNVCSRAVPQDYTIPDATGAPRVFDAGTQIRVRFTQGVADPTDPPLVAPQATLEGSFGNWTMTIDDGGKPLGTGTGLDANLVLTIQATRAP